MSPWEEMEHFDIPLVTNVACPTGVTVVVGKDPRRVGLMIASGTSAHVSLAPNDPPFGLASDIGIYLTNGSGPFRLSQKNDGPLAQVAWCANNPGATTINLQVIQILLKDWPAGKRNGIMRAAPAIAGAAQAQPEKDEWQWNQQDGSSS